MATLQDLLNSGMSRDEINAILSQSSISTDGFQQPDYSGERGVGNYPAPMQGPQPLSMDYGGGERTLGNYPPSAPSDYRDARDLGAMSTGGGIPQPMDFGPPVMPEYQNDNMLPPPQYRGESMANTPPRQFLRNLVQPQQQPPRFTVGDDGLSRMTDRPGVADQAPMNSIRNNTTGVVTDLSKFSRPRHDVYRDGPQVMQEFQNPDGTTERIVKRPTTDGFGRQTTVLVRETVTPDYLNPAMLAKQKYEKGAAEIAQMRAKPQVESTYDKRMAELRAEDTAAKQPGTAAYKRIQDEAMAKRKEGVKNAGILKAAESSKQYSESVASEVDVAIAALFNTTPDKLPELFGSVAGMKKAEGQTEAATGSFDVLTPTIMQGTANVEERAKRLQSMAELMGLTNLRKAGVAPGSITEKEWPKFGAQLGNISLRMGDKEFADEMARIWRTNQQLRGTGQMDLDDAMKDGDGGQATASAVQSVPKNSINHQETMFNAKKAIAKNPAVRDAVIAKMKSGGYDTSGL